ncbi:hypothetical protein [Methylobacterium sp. E-025]
MGGPELRSPTNDLFRRRATACDYTRIFRADGLVWIVGE